MTERPWQTPALDRFVARTELPLLILSVLLIPVLVVPAVSHTSPGEQQTFDGFDYGSWAVFVLEYLIRLRLATRRWLFVRHNLFDLALIAIPVLRPLRLARAARALRSARLTALLGSRSETASRSLQDRAVAYVLVTAGALTLVCSVLILQAERHAKGANIHSYGDAIWWAVTTVSTVGYGDRYPVTALGRLIAVVLIFAGVSLFGVVTAAVAAWFVRHVQSDPEPAGEDLPARLTRLEETLARIEGLLATGDAVAAWPVGQGATPVKQETR